MTEAERKTLPSRALAGTLVAEWTPTPASSLAPSAASTCLSPTWPPTTTRRPSSQSDSTVRKSLQSLTRTTGQPQELHGRNKHPAQFEGWRRGCCLRLHWHLVG